MLDCTTIDTCGIRFRSKDSYTDSSINCKGTLYGWDGSTTTYMDIVSKINTIYRNLQATNTLLNATLSGENALELQVFKQTDFVVHAFLKWHTYRALNQRVVNDSPPYFPTNTTTSILTYMQNTFLRECV